MQLLQFLTVSANLTMLTIFTTFPQLEGPFCDRQPLPDHLRGCLSYSFVIKCISLSANHLISKFPLLSSMRGPSRRAAPPCTAGWRSSVAPVWTAAVPNGPPPISPCLGATLVKVAPPASSGPAKVDANQTAWASCECRVVGEKCCCQMICKTNLLVISEFESQWGSLIQCWYTFSFPLEWFHVSTHCSDLRNVLEPFAAYPKV